jgi:hypothetical protein
MLQAAPYGVAIELHRKMEDRLVAPAGCHESLPRSGLVQYVKCAAVHFTYLRIATSKVCATSSPLDLLPRLVPAEPLQLPPTHF